MTPTTRPNARPAAAAPFVATNESRAMLTTPLESGFRMPAEWSAHAACWMAWPSRTDLWGGNIARVQDAFAAVAAAIAQFEPVRLVAAPEAVEAARQACGSSAAVIAAPIDDAWIRDSGPTFLTRNGAELCGTAWRFNAWGGKSPRYGDDARLADRLLAGVGARVYHSSLTLEGGAIHTDGRGTVITTESVVLNANRNPGLTKAEAERELCHALGVHKVIWLPGDLDAAVVDITDGHIDGIVTFTPGGCVLFESNPAATGDAARMSADNRRALELATDASGRRLDIIAIDDAYEAQTDHELFCRSYVNFYIANGGIVMPRYGTPGDERARSIIRAAFPSHQVLQVDIHDIAAGGGGIHCITQQQPLTGSFAEVSP